MRIGIYGKTSRGFARLRIVAILDKENFTKEIAEQLARDHLYNYSEGLLVKENNEELPEIICENHNC